MSRGSKLALLVGVALVLGLAPMLPASADVVFDVREPINWTVYNSCTEEDVILTGEGHSVLTEVGRGCFNQNINCHLTGVGQTSGQFYGASGAVNFDVAPSSSGDYPFSVGFRIVPPNPVVPPNPTLPLQYLVTIAADGSVASASVSVGGGGDVDGGG